MPTADRAVGDGEQQVSLHHQGKADGSTRPVAAAHPPGAGRWPPLPTSRLDFVDLARSASTTSNLVSLGQLEAMVREALIEVPAGSYEHETVEFASRSDR